MTDCVFSERSAPATPVGNSVGLCVKPPSAVLQDVIERLGRRPADARFERG